MPIREKRGKWQIRFMVNGHTYYEMTDLDATERNRTKAIRAEANAREAIISGKKRELRVKVVPFSEAAESFLTWAKGEYRAHPNSALRLQTSFASLKLHFGKRPVSNLTPGSIEDYKAWRRNEHEVREITLRHDLHALSVFVGYAQKQGWLHSDPLEDVEIPSDKGAVRMHVLTVDEELRYFEAASARKGLYDFARLIRNQGCRPEEVAGLAKANVSLATGKFRITDGKSEAAKRELVMTAETEAILRKRMAGVSPWIFPSPRDPQKHVLKFNKQHDAVIEKAGLEFVLYDLRHTFATRMAEKGMPPAVLASILGHGDLRSISKYVHVRQDAMDRAMREYGDWARSGPVDTVESMEIKGDRVN